MGYVGLVDSVKYLTQIIRHLHGQLTFIGWVQNPLYLNSGRLKPSYVINTGLSLGSGENLLSRFVQISTHSKYTQSNASVIIGMLTLPTTFVAASYWFWFTCVVNDGFTSGFC
jgi:hypothetical protein